MISVIIVTFNAGEEFRSCLGSISRQTYAVRETIIINNAQGKTLNGEISKYKIPIRLFNAPSNLFYCQALNQGIRMSRGDFILCLNDDVILEPGFIEEGRRGFCIHRKIGMVSGKLLRSNKEIIDSAGLFLSAWRTARERGYGIRDSGQFEKEGYIFGVNGAVAFYRRQMLEDIQKNGYYYDPEYRIFYEDLDIAWRAQRKGWKGYYLPQAVAYHVRGATVRTRVGVNRPFARIYLNDELHLDLIKNRYLTIIRNESVAGLILHSPFILIYDLLLWAYVLIFNARLVKKFLPETACLKRAFLKRVYRLGC